MSPKDDSLSLGKFESRAMELTRACFQPVSRACNMAMGHAILRDLSWIAKEFSGAAAAHRAIASWMSRMSQDQKESVTRHYGAASALGTSGCDRTQARLLPV